MKPFKGKVLFQVISLRKEDDKLRVIKTEETKFSSREFNRDLKEFKKMHSNIEIEYVFEKPEKFQIGKIYIRNDNRVAWMWEQLD